jgi:hypothetical protein
MHVLLHLSFTTSYHIFLFFIFFIVVKGESGSYINKRNYDDMTTNLKPLIFIFTIAC